MQRIGITASKIAKGNRYIYHAAVILIACLFAVFAFLVCGFAVATAVFTVALIVQLAVPSMSQQVWLDALRTCLMLLGVLIGIAALVAVIQNIKFKTE